MRNYVAMLQKPFDRLCDGHSRSRRLHGRAGKFVYGRKDTLSWWFVLVAAPAGAAAVLEPSDVADALVASATVVADAPARAGCRKHLMERYLLA